MLSKVIVIIDMLDGGNIDHRGGGFFHQHSEIWQRCLAIKAEKNETQPKTGINILKMHKKVKSTKKCFA